MHETFTFFNSWVDIEVKLHWINEVDHGIVSVGGSEIPFPTTVGMLRKTLEIMGFQLPTSTGEFTGFLNHQQYGMSMWNVKLRTSKRIATSTAWNRCCFLYRLWGSISSRAYYSDLLRRQRGRWIRFLLHLQGQFLQRSLVTFPHELIKAPHLRFVGKRYPRLLFSPWPRVHGNSLEFLSNFGCNLPWKPTPGSLQDQIGQETYGNRTVTVKANCATFTGTSPTKTNFLCWWKILTMPIFQCWPSMYFLPRCHVSFQRTNSFTFVISAFSLVPSLPLETQPRRYCQCSWSTLSWFQRWWNWSTYQWTLCSWWYLRT